MPGFDTYAAIKRLQETGLTEAQAAAMIREQLQVLADQTNTKDEFEAQGLRIEALNARIDKLEAKVDKLDAKVDKLEAKIDKLEAKIESTEARLVQYMVGLNLATIATLAAMFKWMQG
jgi:peptidoglycan hydrolase CwlO-like protein